MRIGSASVLHPDDDTYVISSRYGVYQIRDENGLGFNLANWDLTSTARITHAGAQVEGKQTMILDEDEVRAFFAALETIVNGNSAKGGGQ